MATALTVQINGQPRTFAGLAAPVELSALIDVAGLKADRIAIEHNGEIAPRNLWPTITINAGDRLEIVHFVGGG